MPASLSLELGVPLNGDRLRSRCGLSAVVAADIAARLAACPDVRSDVVAQARTGLVTGPHPSPDDVALALIAYLTGGVLPTLGTAVHGSVVASRCQSQAKRPT
ncbi:MAG TPA: hypothetical protein VMN58_00035 [Acidimicrobiales bacterium]|nr:hypothetical protein [Acidimicrobiales bacterium]